MKYDSRFGLPGLVQVDFPSGGLSSGPPGGSSQLERRLPPMENRVGLFSRLEDSNVSAPRPDNDGRRDPGLRTMPRRFPWLRVASQGPRLHEEFSRSEFIRQRCRGTKTRKNEKSARCDRARKRRRGIICGIIRGRSVITNFERDPGFC